MKNKVLVELLVPEMDEIYIVYIPVNRKIGNVINLINKSLFELTNGLYQENNQKFLYSRKTGERYSPNHLLRETDIRNGSEIVLL